VTIAPGPDAGSRVPHLSSLDEEIRGAPGTISVYCGPLGGPPAYAYAEHHTHYAASTMKAAVLAALYRSAERGEIDLAAEVPVRNEFDSAAAGAPVFSCRRSYDNDEAVWERLDGTASLRWLAGRMIVRSSNLATNLVLARVGTARVAQVWGLVGAVHSVVGRGIEDAAARESGINNLVTAADLAALLSAIALGAYATGGHPLAGERACREMLEVLFAQECREDLAAGLPEGTRIAHKNGWVDDVRHGAGVVFPDDADPYALVVCATTPWAHDEGGNDDACRFIARVAAASWADRHAIAG
jgi:beta-lactamase class A